MKKVLFGFVLCWLPILGFTQTDTTDKLKSQAGLFAGNERGLIQTEFIDFGNVKLCEIQLIHFTNLFTGFKESELKFSFEALTARGRRIKTAFLDSADIDKLIKSVKIIQKKLTEDVTENYTDISFISRRGFRAGCYSKKRSWSCYIKLDNNDDESLVALTPKQLSSLLAILENAKPKM